MCLLRDCLHFPKMHQAVKAFYLLMSRSEEINNMEFWLWKMSCNHAHHLAPSQSVCGLICVFRFSKNMQMNVMIRISRSFLSLISFAMSIIRVVSITFLCTSPNVRTGFKSKPNPSSKSWFFYHGKIYYKAQVLATFVEL